MNQIKKNNILIKKIDPKKKRLYCLNCGLNNKMPIIEVIYAIIKLINSSLLTDSFSKGWNLNWILMKTRNEISKIVGLIVSGNNSVRLPKAVKVIFLINWIFKSG